MPVNYRKIWSDANGPIPHDQDGRSFEIHHRDGNHENSALENLMCLSISEHYAAHEQRGEYGACLMIARRMLKSPDELRQIQLGKTIKAETVKKIADAHRKGHASGRIQSWNQGKKGTYKLNCDRTGKRFSAKLTQEIVNVIRAEFEVWRGSVPCRSETNTFARLLHKKYGVTIPAVRNVLIGKSWGDKIQWI